jgi:hypothetical protein
MNTKINKMNTLNDVYGRDATLESFGLSTQLFERMEEIFDEMVETDCYEIDEATRIVFIVCLLYIQYECNRDKPLADIMQHISHKTRTPLPRNMVDVYEYLNSIPTKKLVDLGW